MHRIKLNLRHLIFLNIVNMKLKSSIILLTLLLVSCAGGEWDQSDPNMPDELRASHQEQLESALETLSGDSQNVKALFEAAFQYHQLGDYKKAVKYYEKVLEVNSTDWATLNNLAAIYEEMEDYENAAKYIMQLYPLDETNIEVINDTVRILLEAGDDLNAQNALENFSKKMIDPSQPDADIQKLVSDLYQDIMSWREENGQSNE